MLRKVKLIKTRWKPTDLNISYYEDKNPIKSSTFHVQIQMIAL